MKKWLSLILCLVTVLSLTACGTKDDTPGQGRGKIQLTYWAVINENNHAVTQQLVDKFNETNERYTVKLVPKTTGYSASLGGILKGKTPPNIVQVDERYFKQYVNEGYLASMDSFIQSSNYDLSDFWETTVERFRYNPETGYSGGDNPLYALPSNMDPAVLFYNATALKEGGVNIISVAENQVADYNAQNGTKYLAKAFQVYDTAPAEGLTAKNGKYYVYNNQIPMSWDELIEISKLFTKSYNPSAPTNYGFFNEWWFSFGWGVGGDCLEWDESKGQYVFALGEETDNYLVTGKDGITVNGNHYEEGELLSHTDKHYVAEVLSNTGHADYATVKGYVDGQNLYALPSIRDAFELFLQLPQSKDKIVTDGVEGLAVSPTPTIIGNKSKTNLLTSNEVAFVSDAYSVAYNLGKAMEALGKDWDVAPMYQYREYDSDGRLKTVNGTPVVGKLSMIIPSLWRASTTASSLMASSMSRNGVSNGI